MGYTYRGFDGYGVMPAYLGQEGWCLTTELKPGSENGQSGFGFVLDRVFPAARALTTAPLLLRLDSGHDALENRARAQTEQVDFVIKWNPRQTNPAELLAQAEALGTAVHWEHPPGQAGRHLLGPRDPDLAGHRLHPPPGDPRGRADHRPPGPEPAGAGARD